MRNRAPRCLAFALAVVVFGGCAAPSLPWVTPSLRPVAPSPTDMPTSPSSTPAVRLSPAPATPIPTLAPTPMPAATPTVSCAARALASMTEPQRIGQVFMLGLMKDRLDAAERAAIAEYHFGSMAFTARTTTGVAAIRAVTDAVQAQATTAATDGIGFFVAANQEGGVIQALAGPGFDAIPSALVQGTWAPAVLKRLATGWGRELRAAGVNLDLAPVADVVPPGTDAQNAPIGQLGREFGHDPATVASHVDAIIAGMRAAGVATSAKHFPGLGRVAGNTDVTAGVNDAVTTRHDAFLEPFARAVEAGVPFVMVALATYERIDPSHLAAFSPVVVGGMLRADLSYPGVVISDAIGATAAVAAIPPGTRAVDFLEAGGDMIISNEVAPAVAMAQALASQATSSASFRARIDDAVLRVLRAKQAQGLLACGS